MKEINKTNELSNQEKGVSSKSEISTENSRRKLKDAPNRNNAEKYKMDNGATMERMKSHLPETRKKDFNDGIESGANPKVRLIPKGEKFYRTGRKDGGSYFTKEHPGFTGNERKENLQLPPDNDGKKLSKVQSARPQLGIQSDINPQPDWAKQAGYEARPGMKQVFVPSSNEYGALADEDRFKIRKNH